MRHLNLNEANVCNNWGKWSAPGLNGNTDITLIINPIALLLPSICLSYVIASNRFLPRINIIWCMELYVYIHNTLLYFKPDEIKAIGRYGNDLYVGSFLKNIFLSVFHISLWPDVYIYLKAWPFDIVLLVYQRIHMAYRDSRPRLP